MINPISQQLANMTRPQNNLLSMVQGLRRGDPSRVFDNMIRSNPQFAHFVNQNRGLTPGQIAQRYGVNIEAIRNLIR